MHLLQNGSGLQSTLTVIQVTALSDFQGSSSVDILTTNPSTVAVTYSSELRRAAEAIECLKRKLNKRSKF